MPLGRGKKILEEIRALREKEEAQAMTAQMQSMAIADSTSLTSTTSSKSTPKPGGFSQTQTQGAPSESKQPPVNPFTQINKLPRTYEGREISTRVNCLRLQFLHEGKHPRIFQYHASFSPDVDGRSSRCKLASPLLEGYVSVFDGTIAYVYEKQLDKLNLKTATGPSCVEICLKLVKELDEYPTFVLNNIFRSVMTDLRMVLMRRNYFNVADSVRLPQHRLEVWPGFVTSIDYRNDPSKPPGQKDMLLTMDVSNRVLRTMTVLDMYYEMMEVSSSNKERMQEQFMKSIIGSVVLTRYNNRSYRVDGIEWSKSVDDKFELGDGTELTFRQYYQRFHNLTCTDTQQPMLISRIRRVVRVPSKADQPTKYTGRSNDGLSVLLIPEFCYLSGLTDALRADFKAMKDLSAIVHLSPSRRLEKLKTFVDSVHKCDAARKRLESWGLELPSNDVVTVPARILPSEKVIFGNNREFSYSANADWGKELSRSSVLNSVPVQNWLLLYPKRMDNLAAFFEDTLSKEARHLGLMFANANHRHIQDDRTGSYVRALREELGDGQSIQLVVILFPAQREDRYSAVKKLCCLDVPVASQVVCARSLTNANKARTICQRIMLQINCKMGGALWTVPIPISGLMVIGIDVYHGGLGGESRKSVGAIVCSTNGDLTRWYSRVTIQASRQELIDGLKLCLGAALRSYHSQNLELPRKIILFRDGVGDGNFNTVRNYEIDQMTSLFPAFAGNYEPQFAALIIHKRINNRIMYDDNGRSQPVNPHVGTVVDTPLNRRLRENEEFFLVSQHVNQGTVNPTRFIMVANTTKLNLDKLQRLSFKLTHMYYNWPGTVRVPAPCVYAHKLAYLVGQNLHAIPSDELADRLYYL